MPAPADKKRRKSYMDNERLVVVEERLENVVSQLPSIQGDVKEILSQVGAIKLSVATLPTWDAVRPYQVEQKAELAAIQLRVAALETKSTELSAGAKTLVFVGGVVGAFVGWALSYWK